jgi:hypothetical protein
MLTNAATLTPTQTPIAVRSLVNDHRGGGLISSGDDSLSTMG